MEAGWPHEVRTEACVVPVLGTLCWLLSAWLPTGTLSSSANAPETGVRVSKNAVASVPVRARFIVIDGSPLILGSPAGAPGTWIKRNIRELQTKVTCFCQSTLFAAGESATASHVGRFAGGRYPESV